MKLLVFAISLYITNNLTTYNLQSKYISDSIPY